MPDVACANCGHHNQIGSNFCSSCGQSLDDRAGADHTTMAFAPEALADAELATPPIEVPAGDAMLVVKRGPNVGGRYLLDTPVVTAGRHPDSDIFLDDVTVSRRHAEILHDEDGYRLRDVGSLNGTYLNRERIEAADLKNGDELQIGTFRLVFVSGAEE